ncbi:hypothetical protein FisN_8Lh324 [Fistulifera solaris]|uniref:Uncharacterized protein n=1 Tax=Fistulifera solaris TaxID=1519565 RepID=A0A1Z5JNF2_FISSO|nr:hypothetical protein FisN_8Lh324 [Fistulifera solaris]|eukprot:GAX15382.1 hypothetical protein FisN_8Lh324 [Fistulifera solaris]
MKAILVYLLLAYATAYSISPRSQSQSPTLSRRSFGATVASALGSSSALLRSQAAVAKADQEEIDKQNILKGYTRLTYLLDNWVDETTICGANDNPYTGTKGCERNPMKVMDYMGFKSIKDPLFKADKTMRRLERLVPASRESDYIEAIEKFSEASEEASNMAYVSSWGEANPGGGKDRVELFIERAKKNVIDARDSLSTVIEICELK